MNKDKIIALKKPEEISTDPLTELLRHSARRLIVDEVETVHYELLLKSINMLTPNINMDIAR